METMNVELTADEAQRVINSQRKQIGDLKGRLLRAHICTSYLNSEHVVPLTDKQLEAAIKHMRGLIDSDQPSGPEDWDFHRQYDHEAIEERIKEFEVLLAKSKEKFSHNRVNVPIYSYAFWYIMTSYDDSRARGQVDMFESLRKYLWKEGEPVPPNHFSSNGVWF